MANIENPRKQFNFSVQVVGYPFNPFLAQEVDTPDVDIDVVTHGDTNYDVKTGGRKKYSSVKMMKIMTATGPDNWLWNWLNQIQNEYTGGGDLPIQYKKTLLIQEFSNNNVTPVNQWFLEGCWPNKLSAIQLRRLGSENTAENIEFQCDRVIKV